MSAAFIILAAGNSIRFRNIISKPLVKLNETPIFIIILQTIIKFKWINQIVLVVKKNNDKNYIEQLKKYNLINKRIKVITGEKSRFKSLQQGSKQLLLDNIDFNYLFIHDGARPLVGESLINNLYKNCQSNEAIAPSIRISDYIRYKDNGKYKPIEKPIYAMQTPQVIPKSWIEKYILNENNNIEFRDEIAIAEYYNLKYTLIKGDKFNIKLTYPQDLGIIQSIYEYQNK